MSTTKPSNIHRLMVLVGSCLLPLMVGPAFASTTWNIGDVFLGVANGTYQVRDQAGVLKESLVTGRGGFTTGCSFNATDDLFITEFSANNVSVYDGPDAPHLNNLFGGGYSTPEMVAHDAAGNVYVGNLSDGIHQYTSAGVFIKKIIAGVRVDFFDIAADQDTIVYGQEGADLKTASIATGLAGPDFSTGTATQAFAMRFLPDGGLLLADLNNVKRYDAAGVVIDTYDVAGENSWFSLNLDPDGTSFWAGNFSTASYYKFDIATGGVDTHIAGPFNTNTPGNLFGMCVLGEPTAVGDDFSKMLTEGPDVNGDDEIDLVIPVKPSTSTAYQWKITWNQPGSPDVLIADTAPAESVVNAINGDGTGLPIGCGEGAAFDDDSGQTDVYRGGNSGKNCHSATELEWWPESDNETLVVDVSMRESPGKGHKAPAFAPTSCGSLYLNNGAAAFELDPDTGLPVTDPDTGEPLPPIMETNAICIAAIPDDGNLDYTGAGDHDEDGVEDWAEACEIGTDPCDPDTDGDGVLDGADECPLEGPADPVLGEILDPNGCIRQSQCSDGIDNDDNSLVDYPDDPGCDDILDDLEESPLCGADWTCNQELPICGSGGLGDICICDLDVDGNSFCWGNFSCGGAPACNSNADCAEGSACVTSCCGQTCAPVCPNPDGFESFNSAEPVSGPNGAGVF